MKAYKMIAFVLENQAPAKVKQSQEVFAPAIKTAAQIQDEWYHSILDTCDVTEQVGRVKYTFSIDGKIVVTPWISDEDDNKITTDMWKSFFRSFSAGVNKLFIAATSQVITISERVVTFPNGSGISLNELYAKHGILWNSITDLVEYDQSGRVTDLSIAAKKQNVWDTRRAVLRSVEAVKEQEKYDRQFRAYLKQLGRNAAKK